MKKEESLHFGIDSIKWDFYAGQPPEFFCYQRVFVQQVDCEVWGHPSISSKLSFPERTQAVKRGESGYGFAGYVRFLQPP